MKIGANCSDPRIKPECHKCGYFTPGATKYYKCCVRGSCPAIPIKPVKEPK